MIRTILREPLIQFAIGASLVFAYFAVSGAGGNDKTIIIDKSRLEAQWLRAWRRPPTAVELDGLVNEALRDELLYREALRLGLDRDDAVVRNRMLQKMTFLVDQDIAKPSEAELQNLLDSNPENYAPPQTANLEQVFLGQQVSEQEIQQQLLSLNETGLPISTTPRLSTIQRQFKQTPLPTLAKLFGRDFAKQLPELPSNQWQAPVVSGFGVHAVLLEKMSAQRPAELTMPLVRQQLENDWRAAKTAQAQRQRLAELSEQYQIRILED